MDVALGVSGRIGSGKSSLAGELAARLRCPTASFGEYVRSVAAARGLDSTRRDVLQDFGDALIAGGWKPFCTAVLAQVNYRGGPVIVGGIRHVTAARTLQDLVAPTPWHLIAVASDEAVRHRRMTERGLSHAAVESADAHSNEDEVELVMAMSDLVVPLDASVDEAADVVLSWLKAKY